MEKVLEFKWGVSRGRDTYGYNICSLYVDGKRVSSFNGGGYDMEGAALGEWMQKEFQEQLKGFRSNYGSGDDRTGFYGLWFGHDENGEWKRTKEWVEGGKLGLDGACGRSSMERILAELGYRLRYVSGNKNRSTFILTERKEGE